MAAKEYFLFSRMASREDAGEPVPELLMGCFFVGMG